MPRARSSKPDNWRDQNPHNPAAAAEQKPGSGCFSGFIIPPLAVLLTSAVLAFLAVLDRFEVTLRQLGLCLQGFAPADVRFFSLPHGLQHMPQVEQRLGK